jgi:hypothetical protein
MTLSGPACALQEQLAMTTNIQRDTTKLMVDYLNTCNTALAQHADEFPYKQLKQLAQEKLSGKEMGVAVYKDDPSSPHDFFTIRMTDDQFQLVQHGKRDPDIVWKTPRAYLSKVVDNPDDYIEKPAKLDLEWLKSRVGLS